MDNATLVIIDDDESFRHILKRRLQQKSNFNVLDFAEPRSALAVEEGCYAILLDMRLGELSGLDFIAKLKTQLSPTHLIMLTGYASIATTVEAMKRGATDYLAKPVSLNELLQRLTKQPIEPAQEATVEFSPMTPAQVEWEHIQRTLLTFDGNISATAKALGMHRRTLQRKLQKHTPKS